MRALTHALSQQRLHHAYLFTGTRGVGKTTLSRILAKSLNCEGPDGQGGITATPCGVCRACTEIDAGRFVDYVEMDAASNRGVDEMAQLLEQANYQPAAARFKVYMIDEVHMLTNHAFNAMLKTLEEPPPYVKFILATTDPQKIPATVLSRCLQFNLKQMPQPQIVGHLQNILGQEQIGFEEAAIKLLAKAAQGSMRDALSLTDQAIAYSAGQVSEEAVRGMLGALDQTYLFRLLDALAAQDGATLMAIANELAARSVSFAGVLQDMAALLQQIALVQLVPGALDESLPEASEVQRLAQLLGAELVQLLYQIAIHGRQDLNLAPDEFAGFSMTLLRMLAFRPDDVKPQPGQDGPAKATSNQAPRQAAAPATQTAPARPAASQTTHAPSAQSSAARPMSPARAALEALQAGGQTGGSRGMSTPSNSAAYPSNRQSSAALAMREPMAAEQAGMAQRPTAEVIPFVAPPVSPLVAAVVTPSAAAGIAHGNTQETTPAKTKSGTPESLPEPVANLAIDWPQLAIDMAEAGLVKALVRELAYQSECIATADDVWTLKVAAKPLTERGNPEKLEQAIASHYGRPIRLQVELGRAHHTAALRVATVQAEALANAQAVAMADPMIQMLMTQFDGKIVEGSIKPVSK